MREDIIARRHRLRSCDTAVMEIKKVVRFLENYSSSSCQNAEVNYDKNAYVFDINQPHQV
ncbi:hypothetical protein KIN20_013253 [Parelaphostrongylus tenuis]|uniref:Uncharacterized protein n=1 Tax=Parelaphostrongylus tenuis TaxID=148309 RepID=A0AAD5MUE7_PARTN|nr:hypothetical protein KIN20_013253 [Parelaphostrongylus tenuis]